MKKMSLLVALMIAMPLISQAKAVSCRGEDRGHTGLKFMAEGNLTEKNAFGQVFVVGQMTFKVKEPGKPVWEVTLPIAVATYPTEGKVNINNEEGGDLYQEGTGSDPRQLSISDLFGGGQYVSYRSPAIGGVGAGSYNIDVDCKGFKF